MISIAGIDVSKKKLDICLLIGEKTKFKTFTNDLQGFQSLIAWLKDRSCEKPKICMEATGTYMEEIAEFMHDRGFEVSIVNPMQIKAFSKSKLLRIKNDKVDSEVIARFCQANNPRVWSPQSEDLRHLREICRSIKSFRNEAASMQNKLESRLTNEAVKSAISGIINEIRLQVALLEKEMKKIVENNAKLFRIIDAFVAIKGVGFFTACTIISNMPDIKNFSNAKEFAAFVGITPCQFESGTSVKKRARISKIGAINVRNTLYMSAISVKNRNEHFEKFVDKLQKKGKTAKVIIVAVMRKLMHIFFGMLKNNSKFDQNLAFGD